MIFPTILRGEFSKLRRSPVVLVTWIAVALMGLALAGLVWIMKEPESAKGLGLIGEKARIATSGRAADWEAFMGLHLQMQGIVGMLLLSVIAAYVFGREYAEGTAKIMLTTPAPRTYFAAGKFLVASAWFAALAAWNLLEAYALGQALGLPGYSWALFSRYALDILYCGAMALALAPIVAWIAVASAGYLAPMGFAIASLFVAVLAGATELGQYCPWTVPAIFCGVAGEAPGSFSPGSAFALALAFVLGSAALLARLELADNSQ